MRMGNKLTINKKFQKKERLLFESSSLEGHEVTVGRDVDLWACGVGTDGGPLVSAVARQGKLQQSNGASSVSGQGWSEQKLWSGCVTSE
jgi:hypothetical protein